MSENKKTIKILIVATGGTIACRSDKISGIRNISDPYLITDIFKESGKAALEESYAVNIEFDLISPYEILSENLSGDEIEKLFFAINEKLFEKDDDYAGVIVTTGSDTYAYVCAALRLLFSDYEKTIVAVCANDPPEDEKSNGLLHFTAACEMIVNNALSGNRGIFGVYENGLGNTATFYDAGSILPQPAFSDSISAYVSEDEDGRDILNASQEKTSVPSPSLRLRFKEGHRPLKDVKVLLIKPYPGMRYPDIKEAEAVVFDTYHSGTLPTDEKSGFKEFLERAKESGTIVIISGVKKSAGVYASEKIYEDDAVNVLYDVTSVMAYMQTWIMLSLHS